MAARSGATLHERSPAVAVAIAIALTLSCGSPAHEPSVDALPEQRAADLDWLLATLARDDVYAGHLDTRAIRAHYLERARAARTRDAWVGVLEDVLGELYDHHVSLGTNTPASPRLVPSGADMWGEVSDGHATITAVRRGAAAERAGLRAGMFVTRIAGRPIDDALAARRPAVMGRSDPEAASWAFRVLLAGTHDEPRRLTACTRERACSDYTLDAPELPDAANSVTARREGDFGYLRIENSLGGDTTVADFDGALATLAGARGLVLDLRNTPSGGSSDVAEPILGRFVATAGDYQRVFVPHEDRAPWNKRLEPRPPHDPRPLVVLVDRWTGSMGEGMAIGLDALHRAVVVGSDMARLRGGVTSVELPGSHVPVRFQNELLFHVDGTPRERWSPPVRVTARGGEPCDVILHRGLRELSRLVAGLPPSPRDADPSAVDGCTVE